MVLAVDVDDAAVRPTGEEAAAVDVTGSVPKARWASAMIDDDGAEAVVTTAIASLAAAAAGDDDAEFALDEAAAYELNWYAIQELEYLIGGFDQHPQ